MGTRKSEPSDEIKTYPQVACMICGRSTNEPAVERCLCGQYRLCGRSMCHWKMPREHREGQCENERDPRNA